MSSVIAPACRRSRSVIVLVVLAVAALAALGPSVAGAAQHLGERALHKGDRGHDVRVLQDFLTRAGYATPIAGVFGPQTLSNVKRFQRAHHLTVDGVVGSGTAHALRSVADRRAEAKQHAQPSGGDSEHLGDRTLKKGMRGHDVRVLQDYLSRAGVPTSVDGVFGPGTLRNVKRFQRVHGLTVDGVVGSGTEDLLRRLGEGGSAGDGGDAAPAPAPVGHARLRADGTALAPADAPDAIKGVIAAGNRIATMPYVYGGGHGTWNDNGYDCSGSVSFALHGGGLVSTQLDSTGFESYGSRGAGRWITVYANAGHAYMVVAGLRFDTSGASPSRWQSDMRSGSGTPTGVLALAARLASAACPHSPIPTP
ncbi:MAG TPA: peptidoglycan-binding protein [Conexibacter sp.]|nr:peptidoglycan-binding protein [Conexibacter sp.]